ncbi:DUF2442 domain-containing protein [Parahaliea aestuarii]|uniref:DUF2442 domain-containing protein n=1 Tax=Parahaliea aestuarii TaxID=1852021 RepID=A0A5C8ZLP0_9GAMM|nr:DUF2442 domain-containing protein [Parahaliea aestuarii]
MPRVTAVEALSNYLLLVHFDNARQRKYDLKPLLAKPLFAELKNPRIFRQVSVEPGGYAVSWETGADISEYELWRNGVEVYP